MTIIVLEKDGCYVFETFIPKVWQKAFFPKVWQKDLRFVGHAGRRRRRSVRAKGYPTPFPPLFLPFRHPRTTIVNEKQTQRRRKRKVQTRRYPAVRKKTKTLSHSAKEGKGKPQPGYVEKKSNSFRRVHSSEDRPNPFTPPRHDLTSTQFPVRLAVSGTTAPQGAVSCVSCSRWILGIHPNVMVVRPRSSSANLLLPCTQVVFGSDELSL